MLSFGRYNSLAHLRPAAREAGCDGIARGGGDGGSLPRVVRGLVRTACDGGLRHPPGATAWDMSQAGMSGLNKVYQKHFMKTQSMEVFLLRKPSFKTAMTEL